MAQNITGSSWTKAAGLGTEPILSSGYISSDYYEQEIERLWKKTWIEIGRLHTVQREGSYFVKDLPGLEMSVLVTRAKDGQLRAFHNSCSHRCSRLFFGETKGNTKMITCPFHGWAYQLDGRLAVITDERNFFDLDKAEHGLVPLHVDTWEDFVFVCLDAEPRESLREYLGDIYSGFHGYPFDEMTQVYTWTADLRCNWKVLRDAFLESYHVSSLHKQTLGAARVGSTNPYGHALDYGFVGYHVQKATLASTSYLPSPMERMASAVDLGASTIFSRAARSVASNGAGLPQLLNRGRSEFWASELVSIFPSVMLTVFPDLFTQSNWRPAGVDRTTFEIRMSMRPPTCASARWAQEVALSSFTATVLEDIVTVEGIQQNTKAALREYFVLQDEELAIRHSHHIGQQVVGPYPEGV